MNAQERAELVDLYEQGYAVIVAALEGIDGREWDAREAPGEWSVREIVHHLGDSEMAAAFNIRLILAADNPTLGSYDHEEWARKLHQGTPVDPSLAAFAGARTATLPLLRSMTEEEWQRTGQFPDGETISAATWVSWYGPHAHDHADQIRRARAAR
jgi:hypothetical protein